MIAEYSNEIKGKVHAYRFEKWEKETISKALKPVIKKLEREVDKIDNDPDNEGQVTFWERKKELIYEIRILNDIVSEFGKP